MAITDIDLDTANSGLGDDLRAGGAIINANFAELDERTGGYGSHASAPADSSYVDDSGNLGVGVTAAAAHLEIQDLNGEASAVLVDVDDMGDVSTENALSVDVDIPNFTPTGNVTHTGLRTNVKSVAESTGQSDGTREFLFGHHITVDAAGDQYQGIAEFLEAKATSPTNDMNLLGALNVLADAEAASGSTTIGSARGVQAEARASGAAATISVADAVQATVAVTGAGGEITLGKAVEGLVTQTAGTFSEGYQFFGASSGTIGTSWGLWSAGAAKSEIQGAAQSSVPLTVAAKHASFDADVLQVTSDIVAGTGFDMFTAIADADGTPNVVARIRGDGAVTADGSFTGGGADYAELFEWEDGNPDGQDRTGRLVALADGGKIRLAAAGEDPAHIVGVVSHDPVVLGDAADLEWRGKYLRDAWGRFLLEPYELVVWTETQTRQGPTRERPTGRMVTRKVERRGPLAKILPMKRETRPELKPVEETFEVQVERRAMRDRLPAGTALPPGHRIETTDAAGRPLRRKILNPAFDPDAAYVPRRERREWSPVGLLGKLGVWRGEPVPPHWRKLKPLEGVEADLWLVLPGAAAGGR